MKIVIGIDPDSKAHGVAEYRNGVLESLFMMELMAVIDKALFARQLNCEVLFSIENVQVNSFIYGRNQVSKRSVQSSIAMRVGRCQQAQEELTRVLTHYGIPFVLHKPQKGNWADKRDLFEKVTGWKGNSNPDTRAAAYFGFLALDQASRNLRPAGVRPVAITKSA